MSFGMVSSQLRYGVSGLGGERSGLKETGGGTERLWLPEVQDVHKYITLDRFKRVRVLLVGSNV